MWAARLQLLGMMEKAPGGRLLGRVTISLQCWMGAGKHTRSALPEKEGFGNPAANKRQTDREQPVSLQGCCVLWKTFLSSIFPLIPCLEQSQWHREGTRIGATVTDSHSQHVSKREWLRGEHQCSSRAPGTACSEPWRCCTHPWLPELGTVSQYRRSQMWEPQ